MALTDETPTPKPQEPVSPDSTGAEEAVDFSQMSLEDYKHLMNDGEDGTPPNPATQHQRTVWEQVKHVGGLLKDAYNSGGGYQRLHDIGTETAREVSKAAVSLAANVSVAAEQAGLSGKPSRSQQELRAAQEKGQGELNAQIDKVIGPQTSDKMARFGGVAAGLVARAVPAIYLGGESALARIALAGPSFAATANPYEQGLAELAASAPNKGVGAAVRALGEAGSISELDGPRSAMFKKACEGWLGQAVMEGVILSAKAAWALRTLRSGTASAASKAEAQAFVDAPPKPTVVEPEAVHVQDNPDGTAHVVPSQTLAKAAEVGGRPSPSMEKMIDAVDAMKKAEGVTLETSVAGSNTLEVKLLKNEGTTKGAGGQALKDLTALADEHGITLKLNASPLEQAGRETRSAESLRDFYRETGSFEQVRPGKADMVREPGAQPNEFRETPQGPKLDPREAHAQAAAMNFSTKVMRPASAAADAINTHVANFENALASGDPQAVANAMSAPLDYGVAGSPEEIRAILDATAKRYTNVLTAAAGKGVAVEDVMKQAGILRGGLSDDQLLLALYNSNKSAEQNAGLRAAAQHMIESKGEKLHRLGQLALERPDDPSLNEATWEAYKDWLRTLEATAGHDTEAGRTVRYLSENTGASLGRQQTAGQAMQGMNAAAGQQSAVAAGMQMRNVKAVQALFRLTNGNPKNFYAVLAGSKVYVHTTKLANAMQVMKNAMISGLSTMHTIAASGQMLNHFYASMRTFGPLFHGDVQGAREGADILWGLWSESKEAAKAALHATEQGHSIINPQPVHIAILPTTTAEKAAVAGRPVVPGGTLQASKANELVRVPGHIAGGEDEFTRAQAYRAYVRMMGRREARQVYPNDPQAFAAHVNTVLQAAFDPLTGAATFPEALQYAERGTLQAPLRSGTVGKGLSKIVQENSALQIFAPFIRSGANGLESAWQMVPFLNRTNPEVQAALRAGGKEAADVAAKTGAAAAMIGYAMSMAAADKITGSGPKDPGAYAVWSQTHKPYSINFGTVDAPDWRSYQKTAPFSHLLGTTASTWEAWSVLKAQGAKTGADQYLGALVSEIYNNTAGTAYLSGVTDGMDALASGGTAFNTWMSTLGMMAYPRIVASFNNDPIKRSQQGFLEKAYAQTPVLSESLPPAYNWLGEYQYNPIGLANKASFMKSQPTSKDEIADEVLSLQGGYQSISRMTADRNIDLASPKYRNQEGELPWDYMNKIYREGWNGRPGIREALTKQVASESYQRASAGTAEFPGGERYARITAMVEGYRGAVLAETRKHFKSFDDDMRAYEKAKAGATMKPTNPRRDALLKLYQFNR